jgi:hypothetical protein
MSAIWFILGAGFSFVINKSIFWALIHGICGPFYILYLCMGCGGGIDGVQDAVDNWSAPAGYAAPAEEIEIVDVTTVGAPTAVILAGEDTDAQ